jgi:outer membrane cobalamin receptor
MFKAFFFLLPVILSSQGSYLTLDTVLVTAPRYPAKLSDIALATVLIDEDEIRQTAASNLADLLSMSNDPGIDVRDYGAGEVSTITLRGIPSSGVLVLVDGLPLNSALTGIADLSVIDINAIKRVEVMKGPASSLYGANGMGGLVNVITDQHSDSMQACAKIASETIDPGSPFETIDYSLRYQIPAGNFHYYLEGTKTNGQGTRTNSDFSSAFIRSVLACDYKKFNVAARAAITGRDYGIPGPVPLVDSVHYAPVFGDSTATSKFDRQSDRMGTGSLELSYDVIPGLAFKANGYSSLSLQKYHTKYFFMQEVIEDYTYDLTTMGLNMSSEYSRQDLHLVMGFDLRQDSLKARKASVQSGDTAWHASALNYGIWLSGSIPVLKMFSISPSCRYDDNSKYGSFISPQIGLIVRPAERLRLSFSAGRAFRAPGFNDLYWPVNGNPDLKPESGIAYELGCECTPLNTTSVGISLYMRDINDRITWMPGQDGLWKPQNLNVLSIKGCDAQIQHRINDRINIAGSMTFIKALQNNHELVYSYYDWMADTTRNEFRDIERDAAFTAPIEFSLKLTVLTPGDVSLNLINSYTSDRLNYYENWTMYPEISMDAKSLKRYNVATVTASRKLWQKLDASLSVRNIFDAKYSTQFGNSTIDLDYPMPGRTFCFQLGWH